MNEFYKGWRRQVGCITLLMACVAMAGWVQSLTNFSQVVFPLATHDYISIVTNGQSCRIVWECDTDEASSWSDAKVFSMSFKDVNDIDSNWRDWVSPDNLCLNMPFRLRRSADWVHPQSYGVRTVTIPYWSITIPLTLFSAFLLLLKQPKSTEKKTVEPISVEGK